MYIYMQINIWELIKPLNAGKFWQSKSMHADLGTKEEKNISFLGKDVGEGEQAASKERMELCSSASSSPCQREACLSGQAVGTGRKRRATKPRKVFRHWLMEGSFTPHHASPI